MVLELLDDLLTEPPPPAGAADWSETLYEEIDGVRVALPPMSTLANEVANELGQRLADHVRRNDLGRARVEPLFRFGRRGRRPDVAFVPYDRWPKDRPFDATANAWDVVPALAVEVVSPTDRAEDLYLKVREFLAAGVSLVWVVYPVARSALVFTPPDGVRLVVESGRLDGGDVIPGWSLTLGEVLPPVTAPPAPS